MKSVRLSNKIDQTLSLPTKKIVVDVRYVSMREDGSMVGIVYLSYSQLKVSYVANKVWSLL